MSHSTGSRRKICVVVNSRANYGRIKTVLRSITEHPRLELQLVIGASALLWRFGNVSEVIARDGFSPVATVYSIVEGETPTTMAKSTGLAIMELATTFENIRPDVVLTVADRFETIATAIAGAYMNIPVAHTQGGEVTGSIDESVRHAVTKLAHIHFPATALAAENLVRMGEERATVHLTGCPSIDVLAALDLSLRADFFSGGKGVGATIDPSRRYVVVLQHPVTTEYGNGLKQIRETLSAVLRIGLQAIWLWPNVDAGSDDISKGLRQFREQHPSAPIHFYRNFSVEDYARLIYHASCLVGNSSSALREGSFLGVPAVNIGTRQAGRERDENVRDVGYEARDIERAVHFQIDHGRYRRSTRFGDGHAGKRIADLLATSTFQVQKRLSFGDHV
ncbi:MAG: UDP-N-acetylglucosamine 2-epimerase (hydrolyzing) [Alphaproteobacteria bacterium]|nr:UDP-N-acetylglucosamine 2-epimerase (hydrolyzing) [Alphaproteobacteria bacterium]